MNQHLNDLQHYIHERLGSTDEILHQWETEKYLADGQTVTKFWEYIKNAPAIMIVGDYDCDGICASYIMQSAIRSIYPNKEIKVRVPRRFSEGYGINPIIADEISSKMPPKTVVITVDNGITAVDILEKLEKKGFFVLLTDHHELGKGKKIPALSMVIDPFIESLKNPFIGNYWCGAAVAYKLCEGIIESELAQELSIYAGLATIGDCMDLKEGNWGLARQTIKLFREGKAPKALTQLLTEMRQDPLYCTEDTLGFYLTPAFNAPGRLLDNGAMEVLKYLNNPTKEACKNLVELNNTRKSICDDEYASIVEKLKQTGHINDCPIWVEMQGLHEGIVGIIAGKLAEDYKCPVIVLTNAAGQEGVLKGSARSYGNFDIFQYLSSMPQNTFLKMGGHKGAAGLSMTKEAFETMQGHFPISKEEIQFSTEDTKIKMLIEKWEIPELNRILNKFRPFGQGNEVPEFEVTIDTKKDTVRVFAGTHLCVKGPRTNPAQKGNFNVKYKLMHFNHIPNQLKNPERFLMRGTIGENVFHDIITPQFLAKEVVDLPDNSSISWEEIEY